jgi:methyl-accepting chemotaxis protein
MAYLTDARGRQFVDNIGWREQQIIHHPSGFGKDWSERPWFRGALENRSLCITNLYRSAATGDYCFTVAAALRGARHVVSIVGADVNFQRLISS